MSQWSYAFLWCRIAITYRHTKATLAKFPKRSCWSQGLSRRLTAVYMYTCINRFILWLQDIPIPCLRRKRPRKTCWPLRIAHLVSGSNDHVKAHIQTRSSLKYSRHRAVNILEQPPSTRTLKLWWKDFGRNQSSLCEPKPNRFGAQFMH